MLHQPTGCPNIGIIHLFHEPNGFAYKFTMGVTLWGMLNSLDGCRCQHFCKTAPIPRTLKFNSGARPIDIYCCVLLSSRSIGYDIVSYYQYGDVIMSPMASQITSVTIIYSTVYSGAHQRKHRSSVSLAFVWGIHRWSVNSPHKWPVTRKMFPFDDVIIS